MKDYLMNIINTVYQSFTNNYGSLKKEPALLGITSKGTVKLNLLEESIGDNVFYFAKKVKKKKGSGGRLHQKNPSIFYKGHYIPRVDPSKKSRPLVQRVMDEIKCNRKTAQRIINGQQ